MWDLPFLFLKKLSILLTCNVTLAELNASCVNWTAVADFGVTHPLCPLLLRSALGKSALPRVMTAHGEVY